MLYGTLKTCVLTVVSTHGLSVQIDDLALGLATGVLANVVRTKAKLASTVAWCVAALMALLTVVVSSTGWRIVFVFGLAAALATVSFTWLLKRLAIGAIGRVGEPQDIEGYREAIDKAVDTADLPTGPMSALRFAWRLRNGAGPEVDRFAKIAQSLRSELEP